MVRSYEIFMLLLIIVSVAIPAMNFPYAQQLDTLIWVIFVIDYGVRLWKADDKKKFVKTNIFSLIALIPLDSLYRSFRIIEFFRVFRLGVYVYRYARPLFMVIHTNGLSKMLIFTLVMIVSGATVVEVVEPEIHSLTDGLWWAMVTTTTVGYGDISPKTGVGRIVAVILMLVGIGTIGMISGTITTHFLTKKEPALPSVKHIQQELDQFQELTEADMRLLIRNMEALLEWKKEQSAASAAHEPAPPDMKEAR